MPKGKISVTFAGTDCGSLKPLDVTILSLNNFPPDPFLYPAIKDTITWAYGVTPSRTTLSIPKMIFPNSSKSVNDYKWVIPAGVTAYEYQSSTPHPGPCNLFTKESIDITTDACTSGEILVYGINKRCFTDENDNRIYSAPRKLVIKRINPTIRNFTLSKTILGYTERTPITASCDPVTGASEYIWTIPEGWTGSGTQNGQTVVTTTPTVILTPSGCHQGSVKVKARVCGGKFSSEPSIQVTVKFPGLMAPDVLCQTGKLFTVTNVPSGATITWTFDTQRIRLIDPQGSNPCTLAATVAGTGLAWVQATVYTQTCGNYNTAKCHPWVGLAQVENINGPTSVKVNQYNNYEAKVNNTKGTDYIWFTAPPSGAYVSPTPGTNMCMIQFYSPGSYTVLAQARNECGTSTPMGIGIYVSSQYSGFTLSPNPANESVDFQIGNNDKSSMETLAQSDSLYNEFLRSEYYEVTISNSFGLQVYSDIKYSKHFTIPTGNLPEGIYLIELCTKHAKFQQKMVIKH
ncbi:MAG: T9SS type A sorting domain-containing protein [Bacteroidales bacterium]